MMMVGMRKKRAARFGNLSTLRKVHGFRRFDASPAILVTKLLLIALIFFVATESIDIRQTKPISSQDYIILLDSSASMAKTDFNPNRLTAAKEISKNWLNILPKSTRVGLVAFSQDIALSVPLTEDRNILKEKIDAVNIDYSKSGTSLDFALNFALSLTERNSSNNNTILLLTDGTEDVSENTIALLQAEDMKIYSFGIGERKTDEIQNLIKDDEIPEDLKELYNTMEFNFTKMSELSNSTSGKAFEVSNGDELVDALNQATLESIQIKLNSGYWMLILIAMLSIFELVIYAKLGGL